SNKKEKLFGIDFNALTMQETVELVDQAIHQQRGIHLLGVNADKILAIEKDTELAAVVHKADIINADGASVVLASRFLGRPLPERVAGIDLMQSLLRLSNEKHYSVYFIGAKEAVINQMIARLDVQYPELIVAGYQNGYFEGERWSEIATEIKRSRAQLVFIGITSPIKEQFIDFLLRHGVTSVLMGVGGSFDVLSGNIKRAPLWIQRLNLEWLFRMLQEPQRLFRRYFFGNGRFILKVLAAKFK
ncbi:MAG: WecB/TagA/CpsF family glycosyltransferase, partial [Lactobacillus sp.]|nr:WecB/TagA/CpsF family glycosyltransferase [Lactobacillus sp.]